MTTTAEPQVRTPAEERATERGAERGRREPERERGRALAMPDERRTELATEQGKTSISDTVVRKIAGVATREVAGVHALGTSGKRAIGAVRSHIPGTSGPSVMQGVAVEVGERQAAVDLDVVVDYGVSIIDLSQAVRRNVISSVEGMTGLQVTEVNIAVDDVYIGDDEEPEQSRVA